MYRIFSKEENEYCENHVFINMDYEICKFEYHMPVYNQDNFIIELATGIKDINGIEIYEGDVIQYYYISYGCGYALLEYTIKDAYDFKYFCICEKWEEIEIIGNVHNV